MDTEGEPVAAPGQDEINNALQKARFHHGRSVVLVPREQRGQRQEQPHHVAGPALQQLAGAPDLLTVPEAANILRISRNHAYELARRGRLPTVRLGRSLRVPRAALSRLLEETADPAWPKDNRPG